jgi:hypothetical protein
MEWKVKLRRFFENCAFLIRSWWMRWNLIFNSIKWIKPSSSYAHGQGSADGFVPVFDVQLIQCLVELYLLLAIFKELNLVVAIDQVAEAYPNEADE